VGATNASSGRAGRFRFRLGQPSLSHLFVVVPTVTASVSHPCLPTAALYPTRHFVGKSIGQTLDIAKVSTNTSTHEQLSTLLVPDSDSLKEKESTFYSLSTKAHIPSNLIALSPHVSPEQERTNCTPCSMLTRG
jgi:hypothetical protein